MSGDSSAVRASDSWSKAPGFESRQERRERFLLQGQLSVLTLISVSVPPRVTAVALKWFRSFCQKCRWQVTAKHTYTLPNWCMVEWCTQNMRRNGSNSCGTSHATTEELYQYTTSVDINTTRYKRLQSLIQNHIRHVRSESAREQRTAL